jgi:tetratricopeptide (TPR) repeat protein
LDRIIALHPAEPLVLSSRARVLRKLVRFQEALRDIEMVVRAFPTALDGYYQRAHILLFLDRQDEALRDLEQCLTFIPQGMAGWEFYNDMASVCARAGQPDKSAVFFREAFRRNHNLDQQPDSNLVLSLLRNQESEALKDVLNEARTGRFVNLLSGLIVCSLACEVFPDPGSPGKELGAAFLAEPTPENWLRVKTRRFHLGDFDGSATLPFLRDSSPRLGRAALLRAAARLCRDTNELRVFGLDDIPEELLEEQGVPGYMARVLRALGLMLSGTPDKERLYEFARSDLLEAKRTFPRRVEADLALGLLKHVQGDKDGAKKHWQATTANGSLAALLTR